MYFLIIEHVDIEGPGLIEDFLTQQEIPYQIIDLNPDIRLPKPQDFTHVVILGGLMNVYEEDPYPFLREEDLFIKEAIRRGKTILGICLGAQLIAKALGAKIFKAPAKEIGWYDVSLTKIGSNDPLFSNFPKTFPVFQWHEDTFDIPKAGKLIATACPISHQAFRYGENVYGLQFHLEVTEAMIREWMETFEEDSGNLHPFSFSKAKILTETEIKIETCTRRGMTFLENFFTKESIIEKTYSSENLPSPLFSKEG